MLHSCSLSSVCVPTFQLAAIPGSQVKHILKGDFVHTHYMLRLRSEPGPQRMFSVFLVFSALRVLFNCISNPTYDKSCVVAVSNVN